MVRLQKNTKKKRRPLLVKTQTQIGGENENTTTKRSLISDTNYKRGNQK